MYLGHPTGNCANAIVLLKVTKDSDKTIAGIQRDDSVFYGGHLRKKTVDVEGHIDKDYNNRTFLSVTIKNTVREDSGQYSCIAEYIDEYGNSQKGKNSMDVSINDNDIQDVVRHLLVKVSFLENLIKFQQEKAEERIPPLEMKLFEQEREIKMLVPRVDQLENTEKTRTQKIEEIVNRDSFTSAFSVHSTKDVIKSGETLIFQKVLLNLGNDYDMATGVFTAPKRGLYVFSLIIRAHHNDGVYIHLKVNDVIMTALMIGDRNWSDQSSVSTVLSLKEGDRVLPYVHNGGRIRDTKEKYSVFNGYLVKLLYRQEWKER